MWGPVAGKVEKDERGEEGGRRERKRERQRERQREGERNRERDRDRETLIKKKVSYDIQTRPLNEASALFKR